MLRVLALNTGLTEIRLFGAALYEDVPHVAARAARLGAALRGVGADILMLQELVPQRVKKALAAELQDLYPHRAGIAEDTRFYGTGLLTLSRHPVEGAACTAFARQTFEEGLFGPRGMLACTVQAPGFGAVRTINLHATAGGAYRQRRRQGTPDLRGAQLAEALAAACAPFDGAVVLGGDFNCTPDSAPWVAERLREGGFGDAAAGLSRGTWDPDNPLNRGRGSGAARTVDYIYAREAGGRPAPVADARIVLDEPVVPLGAGSAVPVSDHHGLLAALEAA